jgi:hypothetical protein
MILLFSNTLSPRLQYICSFIFKDLMNEPFSITTNEDELDLFKGVKIIYSNSTFRESAFNIRNHSLLFEKSISDQSIECFETNGTTAFFKTNDSDFPFDIFAASFYLLSRYEEYLPHKKDMYGRYAHENSTAFKNNFLQLPLINIWVKELADVLCNKFPKFKIQNSKFKINHYLTVF